MSDRKVILPKGLILIDNFRNKHVLLTTQYDDSIFHIREDFDPPFNDMDVALSAIRKQLPNSVEVIENVPEDAPMV